MNVFDEMRDWWIWITQELVYFAMDCYDFGWPLEYVGDICNTLSDWTSAIAGKLWKASTWWEEVEDAISDIISWPTIQNYIRNWLENIEDISAWFWNWSGHVKGEVIAWWFGVQQDVRDWIDMAISNISVWVSQLESLLDTLRAEWSNFVGNILPTLANLTQIDELIASWFTNFTPFWEGWLDWKDKVIEFFTDPLQWLYNKMDEWFERFW